MLGVSPPRAALPSVTISQPTLDPLPPPHGPLSHTDQTISTKVTQASLLPVSLGQGGITLRINPGSSLQPTGPQV